MKHIKQILVNRQSLRRGAEHPHNVLHRAQLEHLRAVASTSENAAPPGPSVLPLETTALLPNPVKELAIQPGQALIDENSRSTLAGDTAAHTRGLQQLVAQAAPRQPHHQAARAPARLGRRRAHALREHHVPLVQRHAQPAGEHRDAVHGALPLLLRELAYLEVGEQGLLVPLVELEPELGHGALQLRARPRPGRRPGLQPLLERVHPRRPGRGAALHGEVDRVQALLDGSDPVLAAGHPARQLPHLVAHGIGPGAHSPQLLTHLLAELPHLLPHLLSELPQLEDQRVEVRQLHGQVVRGVVQRRPLQHGHVQIDGAHCGSAPPHGDGVDGGPDRRVRVVTLGLRAHTGDAPPPVPVLADKCAVVPLLCDPGTFQIIVQPTRAARQHPPLIFDPLQATPASFVLRRHI